MEPDQGNNTGQQKNETIFVDVVPSRKTIYVGEQFLLTSKIYTQEALQISEVKAPALEGLWKEDLKADESSVRESYNGQNYLTLVFSRSLLTPQRAGEIRIDPAQVTCLVQKKVKSRSPYDFFNDPFFNDPFFDRVQTVEQTIRSNALVIDVKPLPTNPPEGFSGAVGSFSLKAGLNKEQAKVNDAITLRLTISGGGNLMLLKPVKIDFPPDLELFDPKTVQDIRHSASGTTGSVSFDYLLIPRHSEKFRISPIVFSYFDPSDKKYHSLRTGEFNFTVESSGEEDESFISAPGLAGAQGRIQGGKGENVVSLANDIQFIKLIPPRLKVTGKSLFGTGIFYMVYILAGVLFTALIIIRKESIRRNADINAVRNRRARKIAEKRLMNASRLMNTQEEGFHEEILKALWGYLTDKLGINTSDLSRDVINGKLKSLSVPDRIMDDLWKIMDDCELARYGAGSSGEKHEIYNSTIKIISELQEIIS